MYKLIAFDLDGTLTRHRSKLGETNRKVLEALDKKYKLLMVGAGGCERIFNQLNFFSHRYYRILRYAGIRYGQRCT